MRSVALSPVSRALISLCVLLFALDANAVAPTGREGQEPVRVRATTGQGQAAFRRTAAWSDFTKGEGAGWTVRADERTGTPHRMWGAGIDLGALPDESAVESALRDFLDRNRALLGVEGQPPLRALAFDPDFNTWYADFDATHQGVPVWRGGLTFRIKHDRLVMVGADTYPDTVRRGSFALRESQAIEAGIAFGPSPRATHTDATAERSWLPREEDGRLVLRAVWVVRSRTEAPRADLVTFVDAANGSVLAWYDEVRHLSGTVSAEHDTRFPGSGTTVSPVKGGLVESGVNQAITNDVGAYNVTNGGSYQTWLFGDRIELYNELGNVSLPFTSTSPNPVWNGTNGSMAEIDAWVFTHQVRDTFNGVVPNLDWTDGDTVITVNIADNCNAYYDGTLNFFQAGQGCNNTARLADVVYHEWGHGLHDHSLLAGFFDGALSEGAGDTVSFLMTGDSDLAPGFFTTGGVLRQADNTNSYPADLVGEVHEDGLIFAGAMWDTYQNIVAVEGQASGIHSTRLLLAGLLKGGPDIAASLDEALVADDDDGNLANGTPHQCAIVDGFAQHGLGELGDVGTYVAGHAPVVEGVASAPQPIAVNVVGPASCADDFAGGTATVSWRANGGPWQSTALTVNGSNVSGAIPAQPFGTFVEYTITVQGGGGVMTAPTGGQINPYSYHAGGSLPIRCDDFEAGPAGYTHALIAGTATDGADDWQHGAPGGVGGDPALAASGGSVWGNDLGGADFNGQYQNDKTNRLTGPTVQLAHYAEVYLRYQRWLTIEDGLYDQATILANGQPVWSNFEGGGQSHHADDQWTPHSVPLGDPQGSVQLAFELQTDGGFALGGWTIDDVCVLAPATPNNRLGITDFQAGSGEDAGIRLTWTNPRHAPLAEVRVLRRQGSCPANAQDGDVVYYEASPALGSARSVFDPVPTTSTYCYGVFPGDGQTSLGFAIPGWNVDDGSANTPATPEQIDEAEDENGVDEVPEPSPEPPAPGTDTGTDSTYTQLDGCGCSGSGATWPFRSPARALRATPPLRRRLLASGRPAEQDARRLAALPVPDGTGRLALAPPAGRSTPRAPWTDQPSTSTRRPARRGDPHAARAGPRRPHRARRPRAPRTPAARRGARGTASPGARPWSEAARPPPPGRNRRAPGASGSNATTSRGDARVPKARHQPLGFVLAVEVHQVLPALAGDRHHLREHAPRPNDLRDARPRQAIALDHPDDQRVVLGHHRRVQVVVRQREQPQPRRPALCARDPERRAHSAPSIAAITDASSGCVRGANRATTRPSRPTRNFSKFHPMSSPRPASLPTSHW
jgi:hypothetical protein